MLLSLTSQCCQIFHEVWSGDQRSDQVTNGLNTRPVSTVLLPVPKQEHFYNHQSGSGNSRESCVCLWWLGSFFSLPGCNRNMSSVYLSITRRCGEMARGIWIWHIHLLVQLLPVSPRSTSVALMSEQEEEHILDRSPVRAARWAILSLPMDSIGSHPVGRFEFEPAASVVSTRNPKGQKTTTRKDLNPWNVFLVCDLTCADIKQRVPIGSRVHRSLDLSSLCRNGALGF